MKLENILAKLRIESLNRMQIDSYNSITQSDLDVVILSPTGSGKTLAYLLGLVERLNAADDNLQAIVVVPGRELALQSDNVLKSMGTGLRSMSCYGGRPAMDEHRMMKQVNPQVVFGTPGRLNDHIDKGNLSPYGVRFLVIDEFDKCLEMGFHDEMSRLLTKLPGIRRKILLSATDMEQIPDYVQRGRMVRLDYTVRDEHVPRRVSLFTVKSPIKDKLDTLNALLHSFGEQSSIVFLNYRDSVERVSEYLKGKGIVVSYFHGGLDQKQREDALYRFSNGSANIMVATDLASRGLDIPSVNNIIHYQMPLGREEYVHRVGRTARWDAKGNTFFILGPDEVIPYYVEEELQEYTVSNAIDSQPPKPRMVTIYIGKGKKDKLSKGDIVGFLCKKGGLNSEDIGRIDIKDRYTYAAITRDRLSQVLRLTAGEKIKGIKTVVEFVK